MIIKTFNSLKGFTFSKFSFYLQISFMLATQKRKKNSSNPEMLPVDFHLSISPNLIFFSNLLNFQHNRKVLRRSFSLSEKWHCFFIFSWVFHVLPFLSLFLSLSFPTHVHIYLFTYIECSCIWYFHLVYWLNSIHFIWLYSADCLPCFRFDFSFFPCKVVCYRWKIIKAIIISNLILNVFLSSCCTHYHIIQNWIIIVIIWEGEKAAVNLCVSQNKFVASVIQTRTNKSMNWRQYELMQ